MWMASFLTIPLYKLMCNLSYLDNVSSVLTFFNKEFNVFNFSIYNDYGNVSNFFCNSINNECSFRFNSLFSIRICMLDNILIEKYISINIDSNKNKIINWNVNNFFEIKFFSRVSNFSFLEFISLQESVIVFPGETGLVFFRLFNPTMYNLTGISLYFISPSNVSVYLNKIQCFCFDLINIRQNETIELPILFFLDKLLLFDNNIFDRLIYISYIFFLK